MSRRLHNPDVPPGVSISEAVELVSELSTEASGPFVHGILAAIAEGRSGDSLPIGRKVRVEEPGGRIWLATAKGLDRSGHLVVVDGSGTSHSLAVSEVEHLFQ